jgi:hypothetical protein
VGRALALRRPRRPPAARSEFRPVLTVLRVLQFVNAGFEVLRNAHNGHGLNAPPKGFMGSSLSGGGCY